MISEVLRSIQATFSPAPSLDSVVSYLGPKTFTKTQPRELKAGLLMGV